MTVAVMGRAVAVVEGTPIGDEADMQSGGKLPKKSGYLKQNQQVIVIPA